MLITCYFPFNYNLNVNVIEVTNDDRFPVITSEDVKQISEVAKKLIKQEFNRNLTFKYRMADNLQKFIDSTAVITDLKVPQHEKKKNMLSIFDEENYPKLKRIEGIDHDLDILRFFLPLSERNKTHSLTEINKKFCDIYFSNLKTLRKIALKGQPLFTPANLKYYSLFNWWNTINVQKLKNTRIYLTNAPIIIDTPMFVSLTTAHRPVVLGITYVDSYSIVSTFLLNNKNPLSFEYIGKVDKKIKNKAIGYVLAHELGHLLLGLPDKYVEKNSGSLMEKSPETFVVQARKVLKAI